MFTNQQQETTCGRIPMLAALLAVVSLAGAAPALAQVVSWINPAGGDWFEGSNWDAGSPPGPGDIAAITLDGTYTVTLDVDTTVAGLTLGAASGTQTLEMVSRTLTLD